MLRDMTIGQYYPVDSPIHRHDPRVKIAAVFFYLVSLFLFDGFCGYIVVTLFLGAVVFMSKVPLSYILKGIKPIILFLCVTALMNLFFTNGHVLFEWKFISVTKEGVRQAIFMSMRLLYLIVGSSMLTYTTSPNSLTDALERILSPLKIIKVPVHDFSMMMSLALRFIPILVEETNRIINAQSARGADFEEGNFIQRTKSFVTILVPLLVSSMRRANDLAMAMESRCYRGGDGRTKMNPLRYRETDVVGYVIVVVYFAAIILVTHYISF